MAEAFKNLINAQTVKAARHHLVRAWPAFDGRRFETLALAGLDALEFKARAQHLCDALVATLPEDFAQAADVIEASLAPVADFDPAGEPAATRTSDAGLAGWVVWPLAEFVARRGLDTPERALALLHALTQRFTAEWSIRPFIAAHPELSFATLQAWTRDPSPHVRRLASEGSRPRLPWGTRLQQLVADPSPTLPLLAALQDDESPYVRRSVANHLNDIAKDHPQLVAAWLERHLHDAPAPHRALLRHASRSLIKQGDARVLKAWGLGQRFKGTATLTLSPPTVLLGGSLQLALTLTSTSARRQKLVVDYAVHHVKANGQTAPKVFKGWVLELAAHECRELGRKHMLKPITTRRYHAGPHAVDVRVNGVVVAEGRFALRI